MFNDDWFNNIQDMKDFVDEAGRDYKTRQRLKMEKEQERQQEQNKQNKQNVQPAPSPTARSTPLAISERDGMQPTPYYLRPTSSRRRALVLKLEIRFKIELELDYTNCGYDSAKSTACKNTFQNRVSDAVSSGSLHNDIITRAALAGVTALTHGTLDASSLTTIDENVVTYLVPTGEPTGEPTGMPTTSEPTSMPSMMPTPPPPPDMTAFITLGTIFGIILTYWFCLRSSPNKRKIHAMTKEKEVIIPSRDMSETKFDNFDSVYESASEEESYY